VIQTVLGEIPAAQLGITSMHDHLVADSRMLQAPAPEAAPADQRVTIENLGFLRWNLLAFDDNLVLDDPELAATELSHAAALGQRAVVDLTAWGLGPRPAALPAIARAAGMHVVAGCGVYLDRPHPDWIAAQSAAELTATFLAALEDELEAGCGFRAGILGILGTGEPLTASEERVLLGAAEAAGRCGAAMVVRIDAGARRGLELLERIEAAGCPPDQLVFGNVDEYIDIPYHRELAAAGATLEWCFGNEARLREGLREPSDEERLAEEGMAERCVLGCSVWTKSQLRAYGGMGYDHLLARIVPELYRGGVSEASVTAMLVSNPAGLLDR
jgi:phosphotriesterase-related protein